jgi:Na+/H+ antiporter NhaD/arsenite permease-like protein
MITTVSVAIFVLGYLAITQESLLRINKTAIGLVLAVILWFLVVLSGTENVGLALSESAGSIFELIIFLLSAMTLVEILTHYGLFDYIYAGLYRLHLDDKLQFFVIAGLAFIFSAFLNNITATIVFLQIASRFFTGKNLLKISAAIIIAINAGGVFSPIGDVTTTMLWINHKFTALEIFRMGFIPSLTVFIVSSFMIGKTIVHDTRDKIEVSRSLGKIDWLIISLSLLSFLLPLPMTFIGLPPYFGLLLGLGFIWLVIDLLKVHRPGHTSNLTASIERFFQNADMASLYFFIGILLSIGALKHLGVLEYLSRKLFTPNPDNLRIIFGNISIGGLSAALDNIPLTAAAMEIVKTGNSALWVLLALTVGTGGSLLLIGSAPGIISMTMIKKLDFREYLKIASLPAFIAYCAGIIVWFIQYHWLLGR